MVFLLRNITLALLIHAGTCQAQDAPPLQSLDEMERAASRFLSTEAREAFPEFTAQISVRPPDPRLRLFKCSQMAFALAPGADLQGNGTLNVRCESPQPWSLYLGYRIDLKGVALVTTRPLAAHEPLQARDFAVREIEFADHPGKYLRQPQEASGWITKRPVQANQAITFDLLSKPLAIRSGQKVRLIVQHPAFSVSQECTAMSNANTGDLVRCKAPNGRILQGTATEAGTIQVKP